MAAYNLIFSENTIPYSEQSKVFHDRLTSKAFALSNDKLIEFEFANKNPKPTEKRILEVAKLLHVKQIDADQTAVFIRSTQGLRIYLHTKDNLCLAGEDGSFHDVYHWNEPCNDINFGHFYHDSSILGMMTTHTKYGTQFYGILADALPVHNFSICLLDTNTDILETKSPNSIKRMLGNLRKTPKDAIISLNCDGLSCFEFNESNAIELKMKISFDGNTVHNDGVFFVNSTHQEYNDIVYISSSGLYIYGYDDEYKCIHHNPQFSEEKGWTSDHTKTVRFFYINPNGFASMSFTGPKGIQAFMYEKHRNSWRTMIAPQNIPPNMRHAQVMHVLIYEGDGYVYAHAHGSIYLAKFVQMPITPAKKIETFSQSLENLTPTNKLPAQAVSPQAIVPVINLRDRNIWSDIFNCIDEKTGKPKFSLALVSLPDPSLQLVLTYDATRGVCDVLGIGWSMPPNFIIMDDGGSVFPEDAIYAIAFQNAVQPLEYLPTESSSTVCTYTINSTSITKFRAKFYKNDDLWIVDLGSGYKQIYGCKKSDCGAVSKDIVWKDWHGAGFDKANQLERSRIWYLAKVQDELDNAVIECFYDVDVVAGNSGLNYTKAVYIKKTRDYQGNEIEFHYKDKNANEYVIYDSQDLEGNYNWEPVQTRFLIGYTLKTPSHATQDVSFIYKTTNGLRFLSEIRQSNDVISSFVARFEYSIFSNNKFGLKRAQLPNDVDVVFTYSAQSNSNVSTELGRIDVMSDYRVSIGNDYILISFLNMKFHGQVVLRMFNLEMTEELYSSAPNCHSTTKGRWPLLGENELTKAHEVIRGDNYFAIVLFYAVSKRLCLFGQAAQSGEWLKEPTCYQYGDEAQIEKGSNFLLVVDPGSNLELFEWQPIKKTWKHETFKTNTNEGVHVVSAYKNKFVTYDDRQLSLGYKTHDGDWQLRPLDNLPNCISETETILKRFNLPQTEHKIISAALRLNTLKLSHNLVALKCLQINGSQLQSSLKLYTIDGLKNVSVKKEFIIKHDNLDTLVSNEESDEEGNYFKFKYEIKGDGEFFIKVSSFRGPLLEKLRKNKTTDQMLEIHQQVEKNVNSPAKRFFLDLQHYYMSFSDKVILLGDERLTFGGTTWKQITLTETERQIKSLSIPLGDKFILEKANENAKANLLQKGTRATLSQLTVNLTDVRVFYPVYMTVHPNGSPVRLLTFDDTKIKEQILPETEQFSPYSNPYILITHEGDEERKTVIFRQQYGIRSFLPSDAVSCLAVIFDNGEKERITGYEYNTDTARLLGNTVMYSEITIIPANEKRNHGYLVNSLTDGITKAYDNQRRLVKTIPFKERAPTNELKSDKEEDFRKATTIFDKYGHLEIAHCVPYRFTDEDVGYYGFEDYELNVIGTSKKWNFEPTNIIRNGFALTGKNFLHQISESLEGIFQPHNQHLEFVASAWIRLHGAKIPHIGEETPYLKANILTSLDEEVDSLSSQVKITLDDWIYLELIVDLASARKKYKKHVMGDKLKIAIRVGPTSTTSIDIDHVWFAPWISDISVNIFDAKTHSKTAVLYSGGSIHRHVYDAYNIVVGKIKEQNQVEELIVYTKATSMITPRCSVSIKPEMSFYESFAPFSFTKRWKINETRPWLIAPHQLEHTAVERNLLHLTTPDITTESYGFRAIYSLRGEGAAIGINDDVELNHFSKYSMIKTKTVNKSIPSEGEILMVKEGNRCLIWIDGGLYIDQTSARSNTPLKFGIIGSVIIRDVMVFSKAMVKVVYQNSVGEPTQEISLESDNSIVVRERLYDELGRQRITTQDVHLTRSEVEPLITHMPDFVSNDNLNQDNSIWKSERLTGLVACITGHSYAFTETRFDKNPLNEKIAFGRAGKDFSVSGKFAQRFSTETSNLFLANRFPRNINISYQVERKLGDIEDITVLNNQQQKIAQYVHVPGSKALFSTYKLNEHGNLLLMLPPIYFERVGSFRKTNAELLRVDEEDLRLQKKLGVCIDYNQQDKPIRKTTADAGAVEYVYDKQNQLRFVLYCSYNDSKIVEKIIYFTYDRVGRPLTKGRLLDTTIHRNKLLDVNLDAKNSTEYQSINYASFGRDQKTVTMNGDDPIEEVIVTNEAGAVVHKRIVLQNLCKKPVEFAINRKYLGSRLQEITYPAEFFGKSFTLVYGYDRLGRVNSIGTPGNPNQFLKIAHNAAGQIVEETYEPETTYTFKQTMDYNEPGFLTQIDNPYQSQKISYTNCSYGGANRGDGSVTKIKFCAKWQNFALSRRMSLNSNCFVNEIITPDDSRIAFEALKSGGYLDDENRQIKAFYPKLEVDFPIICTSGTTGVHVSNVLGRLGFPREHGYRFDYGAHMELTKAKYFIAGDEPKPLQPDSFANEIPEISTDASRRIWKALKEAQFLIEDPDRTNVSTSHGKSFKTFFATNLFTDLKEVNVGYVYFAVPLRRLLTVRYFRHKGLLTQIQLYDIMSKWIGNSSASYLESASADILKMLEQKGYFLSPLDKEFENALSDFRASIPDIVRVLFTYFGRQLGSLEFDVESYEIDANGNHRIFNTGYSHYGLKYEADSNRVESVQYKAFDDPKPRTISLMQHDTRGNVIKAPHKGIKLMNYHAVSNLLERIVMTNGTSVVFHYDSRGERVLKRTTNSKGEISKEIHYLRDDRGQVLVEREISCLAKNQSPAVLVTMYVYHQNRMIGFIRRNRFHSVLTDHQGSVRLIVRDGEVVAAYDYLPYGNLMRIFGDDPESHISYRYTGQEWDSEIGLYNYHARFYDPSIGRFYQIDPKEQYFSPYKYAGNSPVSMVDPDGEFAFLIIPIAFGIAGSYLGGAAANDQWNPTKWDYKSCSTYQGMVFGGIAGAFLPGGFVASVSVLTTVGFGTAAAIATTTSTGLAIAYLSSAALNQAWNPKNWDFSSPRTWNAAFKGFGTGSSAIAGAGKVYNIYQLLSERGRTAFQCTSIIIGTGLFVKANTDWDIRKPQFTFALATSVLAGPQNAANIFGWIRPGTTPA